MNVPAKDVPVNRFFVVNDPPPNNIYVMRVPPYYKYVGQPVKGYKRRKMLVPGLCENINDGSRWCILGHTLVRLLREDEHDGTHFVI